MGIGVPSLADRAAKGSASTLLGQWLKFTIQFVSIVLLARIIEPDEFGKFSMIFAVAGLALVFSDFGLSLAAIQAKALSEHQRTNMFWLNSVLGFTMAVLVFSLSGPISSFYGDPSLADAVKCLSLMFLFGGISTQLRADLTRSMRFVSLAITDVLSQIVALGVTLVLAFQGYGLWALIAQQIIVAVVSLVLCVCFVRWIPGLPRRRVGSMPLLRFGANTMATQVLTYSTSNVDSILLGKFAGAAALGIYDRAYQIFRLPLQQIAAPMTRVALPVLSRLSGTEEYLRYVLRAQKVLCYVLMPAFAVSAGCADILLPVVLGPGWDGAPALFRLLAVGGIFQVLSYVYYWIFLSTGRVDVHLKYSIVGRLVMVSAIGLGVRWGAVGVAVGSSVGFFALWFVYTTFGIKRTGVSVWPIVRGSFGPLFVATLIFLSSYIASNWLAGLAGPFAGLLAGGFCVLLVFVVALVIFRPVRADVFDIWRICRLVIRRKS